MRPVPSVLDLVSRRLALPRSRSGLIGTERVLAFVRLFLALSSLLLLRLKPQEAFPYNWAVGLTLVYSAHAMGLLAIFWSRREISPRTLLAVHAIDIVWAAIIGIFAVGICRAAGASRIIASDVNETRLALAKRMGADDVVHPNELEKTVKQHTDGLGVDVVLEMSGVPSAIHQAFALVRPAGRVQMLGVPAKPMQFDFATEMIFKGVTVYGVTGRRMYETWIQMTRFLRSHEFDPTPVITHRFPLECADEAIHAIKSGEAGKVIFEIA